MDAEVSPVGVETTSSTSPRMPDLRQRQRDRMSPRRPFAKAFQTNAASGRDAGTLKTPSSRTTEYWRKRQVQDGVQHDDHALRNKKSEAEDGKFNITPDGGSAGREGRQFTVSKVGNNGRIYLRPTIRPANQRYPQPAFTFPSTPPSTAGLETFVPQSHSQQGLDGTLTPLSPPTPSAYLQDPLQVASTDSTPKPRHKRAHSYSTIDEHHSTVRDSEVGAFKVIIERPGESSKPSESTEPFYGIPTLEVPIPSYKLGTPRFSVRGTAFLRNSSHTGTEDIRSSIFSGHETPHREQSSRRPTRLLSRRHSDASPQPILPVLPSPNPFNLAALPTPDITRPPVAISPDMFDALTFKPACDHPSVVRYSATGAIRAATPARLVAEITSPTFVDYDLLSDFFLTYRSFLETSDLLGMLIARLKWALLREDEVGTIVRVRTFVAIRHWILNYFLDDFVIDYELRKSFCELLNNFVSDLPMDKIQTKVPLKILGELKKCWRRVCALYWDGPDFDTALGADVDIFPGGIAGSRDPKLDPSFWQDEPELAPRLDGIIQPDFVESESAAVERGNGTFFADVSRAGHLGRFWAPSNKQTEHEDELPEPPLSPTSILSEEVVSCSFPSRGRTIDGSNPLGAHPVTASSAYENSPHIATTPKALTGKRVRPTHSHKRSGSFSDSFRDHRIQGQPVQKVIYKSTEILLALPYAGSLVRGNLLPPAQAFVEVAPSTPGDAQRSTTLLPNVTDTHKGPSAMSGPGMKKLLGSVRRALSMRNTPNPNSSPTQGSFPHIPPLGVRGATINRLPGTAVVPQARPRYDGAPSPMRIDLLGAVVAEDFKRAVEEDAEAEAEAQRTEERSQFSAQEAHSSAESDYSLITRKPTLEPLQPRQDRGGLVSGLTTGTQSIVIVDDTMPSDYPVMTGALPASTSLETFAEAFVRPSGGPTPPTTPPERHLGTPRRSSHLLGHHAKNQKLLVDEVPPLPVDPKPSIEIERSTSQRLRSRPSTRSRNTPYRVKKSTSLRRYASFQSGITHHRSERSFDATTFSETVDHEPASQEPSIPAPLRVLRRRPGGDLRAVTKVEDLDAHSLRRAMSTGSLVTYTESVRSSFLYDASAGVGAQDNVPSNAHNDEPRFSLGALAEPATKRPLSLFSTHSSQPIMRPSFEKEARFLAQIPDDVDDDGGVESALLKLEGRYEKRQSDATRNLQDRFGEVPGNGNSFGVVPHEMSTLSLEGRDEEEKRKHRHEHIDQVGTKPTPVAVSYRPQQQPLEELKPMVYQPRGMQQPLSPPTHHSVESYNSIPLLDRGLTDDEHDVEPQDWTEKSFLREPSKERKEYDILTPDSSHPNSFNFVNQTDIGKEILHEQIRAKEESIDQSFLDSDSDISDLSSEISIEVIPEPEYTEEVPVMINQYPGLGISTVVVKELSIPTHPLRQPSTPTPGQPQALSFSSQRSEFDQLPGLHKLVEHHLPPSPEITPTNLIPQSHLPGIDKFASPSMHPLRAHEIVEPSRKTSVHLPFILAFDSQILAQQFTLIEKDALNEIDWKDLIEMRWRERVITESRSWVEFLRNSEPHGVEVVIARFNLMVKWAISECVLTLDLHERVRCIIKYIHIAAQCRKYRNFATLTQLTVALTSKDLSRLTDTWAQVPAADLATLKDLEALVTPSSNFHSLRAEMEGSGADQGCIPFVGIYTHDLLVNQERPSQIASTPNTEPLTNFERCRTDATIVKNLLRLLEASQLYRFLPIEGVTERCLWMAALSDEDITRYGNLIQA